MPIEDKLKKALDLAELVVKTVRLVLDEKKAPARPRRKKKKIVRSAHDNT